MGSPRSQAGTYWNKTQNVHLTPPGAERTVVLWTPWVDRPEDRLSGRLEWYDSILSRFTWQASGQAIEARLGRNGHATSKIVGYRGTSIDGEAPEILGDIARNHPARLAE